MTFVSRYESIQLKTHFDFSNVFQISLRLISDLYLWKIFRSFYNYKNNVIRIMFTYVMSCCFSSSLRSVINVEIKSLKTFSFSSTCSTTRTMSAWFFGVLTLKVSPTAIVFSPTLQFAKTLRYTLKCLSSKNQYLCLSLKSRIHLKTNFM